MVAVIEKDHAEFSASGSSRWLNCPGSIELSKKYPNLESKYAAEGTQAHAVLEDILTNYINNSDFMEYPEGVPKVMIEHALDAVHWIHNRRKELWDPIVLCETKVDATPFTCEGQFGTFDAALVEVGGSLIVVDYKYGAGIAVDPREADGNLNSQMAYYALGIAHEYNYDFTTIELVVIQPRAYHESGETIRVATATMDELKSWIPRFKNGVAAAKKKNAPLKPGKWCRFCPAAVECPKIKDEALENARIAFGPKKGLELPDPVSFQIPDLGRVLEACSHLETWITKVRSHACDSLERGKKIEGWKLVEKKGRRKWLNEDGTREDAFKAFGKKALTEPELLSPAQLEKVVGGKEVKEWVKQRVTTESSGTTLVPESDKRPAIEPALKPFIDDEGW